MDALQRFGYDGIVPYVLGIGGWAGRNVTGKSAEEIYNEALSFKSVRELTAGVSLKYNRDNKGRTLGHYFPNFLLYLLQVII